MSLSANGFPPHDDGDSDVGIETQYLRFLNRYVLWGIEVLMVSIAYMVIFGLTTR